MTARSREGARVPRACHVATGGRGGATTQAHMPPTVAELEGLVHVLAPREVVAGLRHTLQEAGGLQLAGGGRGGLGGGLLARLGRRGAAAAEEAVADRGAHHAAAAEDAMVPMRPGPWLWPGGGAGALAGAGGAA
eukprot:CAMPEP_0206001438 /NCGR_PEP_ID=MMETSP1464-20131121/2105_1 /ASSEMBLY_ACC=CAM_ASM_001124 /TAXON_ID=119497 /ORGANISM="Exanthemachrysis gayraliae, Strain RCC1523" /LENGTH=134 /DNA_ID=CAMNT_0053374751 /DNA_START=603 /DNA_END=1004 /DNA_ORIENTATION=+